MERIKLLLIFSYFSSMFFLPVAGYSKGVQQAKPLMADRFSKILKRQGISVGDVGISIQKRHNLKQWQSFFEVNADKTMIPASLSKILTAVAVFETYPKNFQFLTEFRSEKMPQNGTLDANIYLVGSGDPTLVTERLWLLVHELQRLNIQKITGDLIYDDTVFDDIRFSPTRSTHNHRAYSSPVSGLSFNWNSLFVRIFPTANGQLARVYIDPPDASIRIKNTARTGNRTNVTVDRVSTEEYDSVLVGGVIRPEEEFGVYRSHTQPSRRAANQAMSFLTSAGIKVEGTIKTGKLPGNTKQLAKIESVYIDEIVKMMMKFSNNFISEMLVKKMDEMKNKKQGTLKGGLKIMEDAIKGYTKRSFELVNPSGLTTENKMSPLLFTDVLTVAASKPSFNSEFMSTFPRSGIDGTLKKRLKTYDGRVRAKTGLLNGVVGLAGFINSNSGEEYAFSMIFNGSIKRQGKATDLFDQLAETIIIHY